MLLRPTASLLRIRSYRTTSTFSGGATNEGAVGKKKKQLGRNPQVAFSGGDEGDRTPYLLNAIQALSQVSYAPTFAVPASIFRCQSLAFRRNSLGFWGVQAIQARARISHSLTPKVQSISNPLRSNIVPKVEVLVNLYVRINHKWA